MRSVYLLTAVLTACFAVLLIPGESSAMPSYARQSGASCFSCHSQTGELNKIKLLTAEPSTKFALEGLTVLSVAPVTNLKVGLALHTQPSSDISFPILKSDQTNYNSGLIKNQQGQAVNMTGFSGFIGSDLFLATIGLLNPSLGYALPYDDNSASSVWYRLAFTPSLGGLDFTLGLFGSSNNTGPTTLLGRQAVNDFISAKSFGLDARVRGAIGPVSVDFKTVYSNTGLESWVTKREIGQGAEVSDSFNASATIGFNETFGLSAAYRTYGAFTDYTADTTNSQLSEGAATIGAWINLTENVVLQPQYTTYKVNSQMTDKDGEFKLRFFSGF